MTTWFVSRHPGAVEWAQRQGLQIDQFVPHLEPSQVQSGDTVIGSLPVNLVAKLCACGVQYLHLSLQLPAHLRGQELSATQLDELGAQLQAFHIQPAPHHSPTTLTEGISS